MINSKLAQQNFAKTLALSIAITYADLKLKYANSLFGVLWYAINPIVTFTILYLIFSNGLGSKITYYPAYIILGVSLFNFFQDIIIDDTKVILDNRHLLKSMRVPLLSLILTPVLKALLAQVVYFLVCIVIFLIFNIPTQFLVFYPFMLFILGLFSFGIGLVIAPLGAIISDLTNIAIVLLRILWLMTPIFYATDLSGSSISNFTILNPLFLFIDTTRQLVLFGYANTIIILILILISVISIFFGFIVFRRCESSILENV